jgi:spermidine synthase
MLNRLNRKYTVVAIDAYCPPYIPWHLTTAEFFQEVRDHLTDDGTVAINVGRTTRIELLTRLLHHDAGIRQRSQLDVRLHSYNCRHGCFNSATNLEANGFADDTADPGLRTTLALGVSFPFPPRRLT